MTAVEIRPHRWYGKKINEVLYAYWIESIDSEAHILMCTIYYDLEEEDVHWSTEYDTYTLACLPNIIDPDITDSFWCPLPPLEKEYHTLDWVHV
jgi:hypothetical protein